MRGKQREGALGLDRSCGDIFLCLLLYISDCSMSAGVPTSRPSGERCQDGDKGLTQHTGWGVGGIQGTCRQERSMAPLPQDPFLKASHREGSMVGEPWKPGFSIRQRFSASCCSRPVLPLPSKMGVVASIKCDASVGVFCNLRSKVLQNLGLGELG